MIRFDQVGLRYHYIAKAGKGRGRTGAWSEDQGDADALHGLDFEIPAGGFRWLTGPSGAGKTSLLKLMYLAIKPSEGNVVVLDTDTGALDRRGVALLRRRIGVVYQDFRLLRHLTAYDNVALPLRLARRPEAQLRADVTELLRWVGLAGRLDHRPEELSGGEQQRVAIARAVVGKPSLLLADEPTGNLDDEQAERLMHLIRSLNALGTTVMVATHNLRLVAKHPAPVLELESGRLVRHV